jgi:probable HAF family extracellular repeat protein
MKQFKLSILAAVTVLSLAISGCGGGGGGGSASGPTDPNQVVFDTTAKTLEPLTGGTASTAVAINDSGSVVGISSNTTQQLRGVKWTVNTDGTVTAASELQPLTGFNYSAAYGINESGFVVGESEDNANTVVAVYWANNSTTAVKLLELVAGKNSAAYAVSTSGRIVGEAVNGSDKIVPVYWSSSSAAPVALSTRTAGGTGVAYGIVDLADGSSVIVGESDDRAVRWKVNAAGVVQAIEDLGVFNTDIKSVAMGVNKNGVIVGESEDAAGNVHAVIFKDKTLLGVIIPGFDVIDLAVAGVKSSAAAINDNSSIAGWNNDTSGSSLTALWLANASPVSTVNNSLSGSGGNGLALGINARNFIVGVKSDKAFVAVAK